HSPNLSRHSCCEIELEWLKRKAETPAGTARVLRPHNERFMRVRRLKPCPRKASACSESHSKADINVRISHILLTYEIDSHLKIMKFYFPFQLKRSEEHTSE